MKRTIEVIGDREQNLIDELKKESRAIERKAMIEFALKSPLYTAILFSPELPERALGQFIPDSRIIVLSDGLAMESIPHSYIWNIFLHELAHALEYAAEGRVSGHGAAFHGYCAFLGVESGFDRAEVKALIDKDEKRRKRIEKLIALSSSSFEEEAESAIRMAQKLMAECTGSEKQEEEKKIYITIMAESGRISTGCAYLLNIVEKATGVFLVRGRAGGSSAIRAYGSLDEVEMAIYLYEYLESAIDNEIKRLRKEGKKITRNDFIYGAYAKLEAKLLPPASENSMAIVAISERNRKLATELIFKNTKLRTERRYIHSSSRESMELGTRFGSKLEMPDKIQQKKLQ